MAKEGEGLPIAQIEQIQESRKAGIAVRDYLASLSGEAPVVRRKDTRAERLAQIAVQLEDAKPLKRVELLQRKYDIEHGTTSSPVVDLVSAEEGFKQHAKAYSERVGIVREVWLEIGVPVDVLDAAGIDA